MDERRLMLRNRIIGVLLRNARRQGGRTLGECADALGVSEETVRAYEEGRESISLPELEVLGYLLDTPVTRFTDPEADLDTRAHSPDFESVLNLRHRIVGTVLRQARTEAGMERADLADLLGCPSERVRAYERGDEGVPVAQLEVLARHLDVPLDTFQAGSEGRVGSWHRQQKIDHRFHELPSDVQEFVATPINVKYLEVAMKLSQMPASRLRDIAEGLLEITF
jgi:transcriptional regulator with XRE-family HTH domain